MVTPCSIQLGFKAFDLHELFPHFVARNLGYYQDLGLQISLRDTTFLPETEWPPNLFSTACGGALLSCLSGGDQRILVGAIRGPLFWFAGASGVTWDSLPGSRIASFPFLAPPHVFLRILLQERGLDPDRDLRLEPVRDDTARWGLLREGEVSAALLSSNVLPSSIKHEGFQILACLRDDLQLPTSGLALKTAPARPPSDLEERLREAYQRALRAIRQDHPGAVEVQEKWLPGMKPGYGKWMRSLFVAENAYDPEKLLLSLRKLAREMGRRGPDSVSGCFLSG